MKFETEAAQEILKKDRSIRQESDARFKKPTKEWYTGESRDNRVKIKKWREFKLGNEKRGVIKSSLDSQFKYSNQTKQWAQLFGTKTGADWAKSHGFIN